MSVKEFTSETKQAERKTDTFTFSHGEKHITYSRDFQQLLYNNNKTLIEGSEVYGENFPDWEKGRAFIKQCISHPGRILDFGCANGFLLRCLEEWTGFQNHLIPYGVDSNEEHIQSAKKLFPLESEHFLIADHHFLQLSEEQKPTAFQKKFDYVFWNAWDNLEISATNDKEFRLYFSHLVDNRK